MGNLVSAAHGGAQDSNIYDYQDFFDSDIVLVPQKIAKHGSSLIGTKQILQS